MQIREMVHSDWPDVWPIVEQVTAARETFPFDPSWTSEVARSVWTEAPPGLTVVALEGETVLGTAKMGPNKPGPGSHVATASFMTASTARRRGVARALCGFAIEWATREGYSAMQFNAVVESNVGAVALYEDLGFTIIGTVPQAYEHAQLGRVGLHVMHRLL
jgi:ribosomal protein S18 acetylase RimI-like enzyme